MASIFSTLKVAILTLVVILSFLYSTIAWDHVETSEHQRIAVATAILVCTYALMVFELVNRTLAALIGAAASVAAYDCLIEKASMEDILQWEDLETLTLLFGMMIIVNVLSSSGLFDYLAVWSYRKANGRFWLLITIMSFLSGFLSAFLDNVSTMLLISPTLIKLSELEHVDPRYVLMIMVIFCNIGGCATPVGDPPNLIIIGDHLTQLLGITFGSFLAYCGPCVLITMFATLVYLRLVYKSKESFRPEGYTASLEQQQQPEDAREPAKKIEDKLTSELTALQLIQEDIHRRQLDPNSERLQRLKEDLGEQICEVQTRIEQIKKQSYLLSAIEFGSDERHQATQRRGSRLTEEEIDKLMRISSIKSNSILIQSTSVLVVTVMLFFAQSVPELNLTLGWISLFAGLTLLVMSSSVVVQQRPPTDEGDRRSVTTISSSGLNKADDEEERDPNENFESVINNIEWPTLMFFFALFIMMEVMAKLGLISFMGKQITLIVDRIPAGSWRSIGAITIILWSSGIASACIDNVPFASMMIKVLGTMVIDQHARSADNPSYQLMSVKPLVFALAFGTCFGGNGSLIGASANLVTAGILSRHGYPISFNGFIKFALPLTLISLAIANIYLVLVFVVFGL